MPIFVNPLPCYQDNCKQVKYLQRALYIKILDSQGGIVCLVNLGGSITIIISAGLLQKAVQSDEHSTVEEKASASTNLAGTITLTRGATVVTAAYAIHAVYRWWQHVKEYNSLL
ncbi:hypothetical protein PROFUN_16349 [Planoprotostelium fungivorum]|uniref:Uncharacterized protein n=1 Tax=Planoprotostelium fungivorum TaxID=1890364 RepID=A0A2P6MRA7_9EUKA|nr:hypothetical protein PROFUN_16349 [Planoprotostelium fungivorum]